MKEGRRSRVRVVENEPGGRRRERNKLPHGNMERKAGTSCTEIF
jgi:hypothetical protein